MAPNMRRQAKAVILKFSVEAKTESGRRSARISNLNPEAYHVYCNADSLDLALQDLTRESPPVASALDMTNEIGNLLKEAESLTDERN
ncbi:unnamed protein product [Didymodactylos carnosus]|uniref:Uncharacterized protein n=1 Tax=Didymodactylos carnosus TaxID=1234261 RepID=A0A8S2EXM0_9BILA|nr:unnamed protein product [Didymodactylos carnosus]CAF4136487.1 unnamed protein product [Didymodactylos carnosus]